MISKEVPPLGHVVFCLVQGKLLQNLPCVLLKFHTIFLDKSENNLAATSEPGTLDQHHLVLKFIRLPGLSSLAVQATTDASGATGGYLERARAL